MGIRLPRRHTTAYSFGDDPKKLSEYAWFADNSDEKYHKIGTKKPNPWGLYDMHGNVAEWCLDEYLPDQYKRLLRQSKRPIENPLARHATVFAGGGAAGHGPTSAVFARRRARGSCREWKEQDPQLPQSIWYHTDSQFVGFRVIRPLRVPSAEEAARYELTDFEKQTYLDYKKVHAGKQ